MPTLEAGWRERRDWFRDRIAWRLTESINQEEIHGHFLSMPAHYWEQVSETDLVRGLETIHGFFKLVSSPEIPATVPFVSWSPGQDASCTRVMLCTWDRHGLLAKAAAAFSGVRLNIVQADVYTRSDNVVLDEFCVTNADGGPVNQSQIDAMSFLLGGALSEPPRFVSIWACSRHRFLAMPNGMAPRIVCDSDGAAGGTFVHIEASDRLGLLYDILQTIADAGLNIKQARIETQGRVAKDTLLVTDERGEKLDAVRLDILRVNLAGALS